MFCDATSGTFPLSSSLLATVTGKRCVDLNTRPTATTLTTQVHRTLLPYNRDSLSDPRKVTMHPSGRRDRSAVRFNMYTMPRRGRQYRCQLTLREYLWSRRGTTNDTYTTLGTYSGSVGKDWARGTPRTRKNPARFVMKSHSVWPHTQYKEVSNSPHRGEFSPIQEDT